jgi:hypothetical protein
MRWDLSRKLSTLLLAGTMAACSGSLVGTGVGGDDDGSGTPDAGGTQSARAMFDSQVAPIMSAKCAACHAGTGAGPGGAPRFLGTDTTTFYTALVGGTEVTFAAPASSLILTKGVHYNGAGPALDVNAEKPAVQGWIEAEAIERAGSGGGDAGPAAMTATQALDKFGSCMRQADFEQAGMPDVANQVTDSGYCYSCHSTGTGGAFLSQNATDFFNMTRQRPYMLKIVFPELNQDGSFKDLTLVERFRDKTNDTGHPQYVLADARVTAVETFFQLTMTHYMANDCPPQP